ncbi:MAG: methylamine dehydrogenase light chain [Steroidobacteraceae bacterium]
MKWLDRITENQSRSLAQRTTRRSFFARIAGAVAGGAVLPLLPVARGAEAVADPGDPTQCDYWRYCAIDGFLCSCCGGTKTSCPPGTEMSPITWIGTCENPGDGKSYIISYNDCCGKSSCGNCLCNRNERDRPIYRPQTANDINWCLGTSSVTYHCTVAAVIGTALEAQ